MEILGINGSDWGTNRCLVMIHLKRKKWYEQKYFPRLSLKHLTIRALLAPRNTLFLLKVKRRIECSRPSERAKINRPIVRFSFSTTKLDYDTSADEL